ncbi:MAG: hypothetical protein NZ480_05505 [Bdellovibrionaceae bacterium]|nr:hypothetical protein [Pseudobdellovibrionaceae bacterium]MDW8190368.1 hypothetical protein [Pseudobdellovibrionaceae bacterium]
MGLRTGTSHFVYHEQVRFGQLVGPYEIGVAWTSVLWKIAEAFLSRFHNPDEALKEIIKIYLESILEMNHERLTNQEILKSVYSRLNLYPDLQRLLYEETLRRGIDLLQDEFDGYTGPVLINGKSPDRFYQKVNENCEFGNDIEVDLTKAVTIRPGSKIFMLVVPFVESVFRVIRQKCLSTGEASIFPTGLFNMNNSNRQAMCLKRHASIVHSASIGKRIVLDSDQVVLVQGEKEQFKIILNGCSRKDSKRHFDAVNDHEVFLAELFDQEGTVLGQFHFYLRWCSAN